MSQAYKYSAMMGDGSHTTGVINAESSSSAYLRLKSSGLVPVAIDQINRKSALFAQIKHFFMIVFSKNEPLDLILFTRQFEVMLKGGVPLIRLLGILAKQSRSVKVEEILSDVSSSIEAGNDLSSSIRPHSSFFPELYCELIKAGEQSGKLEKVLSQLTVVLEHEQEVKESVKTALYYPVLVLAVFICSFFIIATYVMPEFILMFESSNIVLPYPTIVCISISRFITQNSFEVLIGIVTVSLGIYGLLSTVRGRYLRDYFLLKSPLIGDVVTGVIMSRFCSIFSILISSGLPILNAVETIRATLHNRVLDSSFTDLKERLSNGDSLSQTLSEVSHFPALLCSMIAVGEESGYLDELLNDMSKHYDREVSIAMKRLVDSLPVVLTVVLGLLVGFFALAVYLPLADLAKAM